MNSTFDTFLDEIDPDIKYFDAQISQNQVFCSFDSIDNLKSNNPSFLNDSNFFIDIQSKYKKLQCKS